jgi:TetR/AcrR family transcriptional regulator, cholesterol catabolism regulator
MGQGEGVTAETEGAANGKRDTGSARRIEILDAAARLFYAKGYAETTIQDIADSVGLLKGSIYHYIGSKEELLFELLKDDHEANLKTLKQLIDSSTEAPAELFRRIIAQAIGSVVKTPWRPAAFAHENRHLDADHARVIIALRDEYQALVRSVIESGQESGAFQPGVDARLIAIATLTLINAIAEWFRPDRGWGVDDLSQAYGNLVLSGILAPGAATPGDK